MIFKEIGNIFREPYGIHLRYICIVGFIRHPSVMWVVAFAISYILTLVISGTATAKVSAKNAQDFLLYFEEDNGIENIKEFPLPKDINWYKRFYLWNYYHRTDPILRDAPPLRIFDVKGSDGNSLINLKSFMNTFATSIIFIRYGPSDILKPIQRFNLYHEIAHCSIPGFIIGGRIYGMHYSAFLAAITATVLAPDSNRLLIGILGLLYWISNYHYWKYSGKNAMLEIYADSFAIKRLAEEDLKMAKLAGNYWLNTWTQELERGSQRWVELKARIFEMKYNLGIIERWENNKIVIGGIREDPSKIMLITDYLFLLLCIYIGWESLYATKSIIIIWATIGIVLIWIGRSSIRFVSRCHFCFINLLLPKYLYKNK